jgi:hypothetical protein
VAGRVLQRESPFENVQILNGTSAEQMALIMQAANASLGVECEHCHAPDAWDLDVKASKQTARAMMRMINDLSLTDFEALETPSCWTCHRGRTIPEIEPGSASEANVRSVDDTVPAAADPFAMDSRPSGQVYSNIQMHTELPANELREVMNSYSRFLGVNCDHCHVLGDWASDEKLMKLVARRMLEIEARIEADFFGSREVLSCWTCHRGEATPQTRLPAERMPSP